MSQEVAMFYRIILTPRLTYEELLQHLEVLGVEMDVVAKESGYVSADLTPAQRQGLVIRGHLLKKEVVHGAYV